MNLDKNSFREELCRRLAEDFRSTPKACAPWQLHDALSKTIMNRLASDIEASMEAHLSGRRACYFSAEFLVGRAVYNNILCLGIQKEVEEILAECGTGLAALEEIEDAALGNGGLGRLAACFLDSAATLRLPLDGYGIRYKYGYFKQRFVDGFQVEEADNWTKYGDAWSKRCDEDTVEVCFADQIVRAVPYDMPILGYGTRHTGNLRLWQAEAPEDFDFKLFNEQKYTEAVAGKTAADNISRVLYPCDDTDEGRILRLKQQYFFCSASVTDILKKHKARYGGFEGLAECIAIQLNDTHPVIAIPELIRQLMDGEGYSFEKALALAERIFSYTNHTVMAEALEKWSAALIKQVLPRVYEIILLLHEEALSRLYAKEVPAKSIQKMKLVHKDLVHMANLASFCSAAINGVAQIHTEILKKDVLAEWYEFSPEKFQNKTNGITQRRWLALCNPELSELLTELGGDGWLTELSQLEKLSGYAQDTAVMERFAAVKRKKKEQLAAYILEKEGVRLDCDMLFDVQVKRLHEYKRQLLNAFSILYIYFGLKDGTIKDFAPTAFIFGAKSAPGYKNAKSIIKYINDIARLVNADEETNSKLKVVFLSNYNVSCAEKIIPAADVSEQISMAGTEASGTGNMKLMLNGAVTLGTYDGANIEIVEEAGEANNYIFGARVEELEEILPDYDPRTQNTGDRLLRRVLNTLASGRVLGETVPALRELYYAVMDGESWHAPDHYYILGDFAAYMEAKLRVNCDYRDKAGFIKKCWQNVCHAGKFSSDRTVRDYAENIWHIEALKDS